MIPISCVDNFYEDPDSIRKFALSLDYNKEDGNYPGYRTKELHSVNQEFSQWCINKIISLFFSGRYKWHGWTMFQKIYPFHEDPNHPLNQGEIHFDDGNVIAGLIYLNPNPRLDSGTSFYQLKEEYKDFSFSDLTAAKSKCYKDGNCEEFEKEIQENNSKFEKTLEVKNVYNRLIFFGANSYHSQTNLYMRKDDFRFTQVFFIDKLEADSRSPLDRFNRFSQKEFTL